MDNHSSCIDTKRKHAEIHWEEIYMEYVSVSDLYIPRIDLPILLQENM
jgi:hypothetical protein